RVRRETRSEVHRAVAGEGTRLLRGDRLAVPADHADGSSDVQSPAYAEDRRLEQVLVLGRPVGLPDALEGRAPKLVGNDAGDLSVPGPLLRGLAQLLHDGRPDQADDDRPPDPLALPAGPLLALRHR